MEAKLVSGLPIRELIQLPVLSETCQAYIDMG